MKNLWKYLSTLGLMLVSCLCLGVGLKSSERVQAAKDYDVYITGGATYSMKSGTISHNVMVENGTFSYYGGTISGRILLGSKAIVNMEESAFACDVAGPLIVLDSPNHTLKLNNAKIQNQNATHEAIRLNQGTFNMVSDRGAVVGRTYAIIMGKNAVFNYTGGNILGTVQLNGGYITFKHEPANEISIEYDASNTKIAKLYGISTIDLTKLNVTNLPSDCKLEIQTISGEKWVVVAKEATTTNYTVTISAGTGGRVSQTSVSVPLGTTYSTSGRTLSFSNGTSVTATANTGYSFDYWSPSSGTITSSTTIYAYFSRNQTTTNYTVTIERDGDGWGDISQTSVSVPSGTTFYSDGKSLVFSNGTIVTADEDSTSLFYMWNPSSGTVESDMTIQAVFMRAENIYDNLFFEGNGHVDKLEDELTASSIMSKLQNEEAIKVLVVGDRLGISDYVFLKLLYDSVLNGLDITEEYLFDCYEQAEAVDLVDIDNLTQDQFGGQIEFSFINYDDANTYLYTMYKRQETSYFDLILYYRNYLPPYTEHGFDPYSSDSMTSPNAFTLKNSLIYQLEKTNGGTLTDYSLEEVLDQLFDLGFASFDWSTGGSIPPYWISNSLNLMSLNDSESLAFWLMEFMHLLVERAPLSDLPLSSTAGDYLEQSFLDSWNRFSGLPMIEILGSGALLLFDLMTEYPYAIRSYDESGRGYERVVDMNYIIYQFLGRIYESWTDGYWDYIENVKYLNAFSGRCVYLTNLLFLSEDSLIPFDAEPEYYGSCWEDYGLISQITNIMRNLGTSAWYWKNYDNGGYGDYWIDLEYDYVGVDDAGHVSVMNAWGVSSGGSNISLSLSQTLYFDNKQYVTHPIYKKNAD